VILAAVESAVAPLPPAAPPTAAAPAGGGAAASPSSSTTASTTAAAASAQPVAPAALADAADAAAANTATAQALRPQPRVRGLSLRWVAGRGSAPGAYRELRLASRAQNVEAALAQARGTVAAQPCASCVRGGGPFIECVVVAGQLGGSCANCHYGSEGARCSFRNCKHLQQGNLSSY